MTPTSAGHVRLHYTEDGVPYYFNHATGASQWALPSDWSLGAGADGRLVFVNSVTGECVDAEDARPGMPAAYAHMPGRTGSEKLGSSASGATRDAASAAAYASLPRIHSHEAHVRAQPHTHAASPAFALPTPARGRAASARSRADTGADGWASPSSHPAPASPLTMASLDASMRPRANTHAHTPAYAFSHSHTRHPAGAELDDDEHDSEGAHAAFSQSARASGASRRDRRKRAEKAILEARRSFMAHYPLGVDGSTSMHAGIAQASPQGSPVHNPATAARGLRRSNSYLEEYSTVLDSASSSESAHDGIDVMAFLGFRTKSVRRPPPGATAPMEAEPECASTHPRVDVESRIALESPSRIDDAAMLYVGMTLQERTEWLKSTLRRFGVRVYSQAHLLTVFLASQSLPFVSSFLSTTLGGTVREARKVIKSVTRAASKALSPRGELPLTMPRRHRSCPENDSFASPSRATASASAYYSETEAYMTALGSPDIPGTARTAFGSPTIAKPEEPGALVDKLFANSIVDSFLAPVSTTVVAQTYDGTPIPQGAELSAATFARPPMDAGPSALERFASRRTPYAPLAVEPPAVPRSAHVAGMQAPTQQSRTVEAPTLPELRSATISAARSADADATGAEAVDACSAAVDASCAKPVDGLERPAGERESGGAVQPHTGSITVAAPGRPEVEESEDTGTTASAHGERGPGA